MLGRVLVVVEEGEIAEQVWMGLWGGGDVEVDAPLWGKVY